MPAGSKWNAQAWLFALLAFFSLGLPRVVTQSAASTLFLQHHGAASLAFVYISVAGTVPFATALFMAIESRVSRFNLVLGILVVRAAALLVLWAGSRGAEAEVFAAAALIWLEIEFVLGSLMFWGLAGQCFAIAEAKRHYVFLGSGEQTGMLAAGFVVALMLLRFRAADLYLVSASSLAAGLVLITLVARRFPEIRQRQRLGPGAERERPPPLNRQLTRYLWLILGCSFLANIGYFLVDGIFYRAVQQQIPDEAAMASFIGAAFAVSGGATLLVTWFAAPHLIARFGVVVPLAWLPMLLAAILSALVLGQGLALAPAAAIFALALAAKLCDDGVRISFYRPAFQTLYQPLPAVLRLRALARSEGVAEPLGIACAGLLLLAAAAMNGPIEVVAAIAVAVFAAWIVAAIRLRSAYMQALNLAASRRQNIEEASSALAGPQSRRLLLERLKQGKPQEVLGAIELLRIADRGLYLKAAPGLILTGEPEVVRGILLSLQPGEIDGICPLLKNRYAHETDPTLRRLLLAAIAGTGSAAAVPVLMAQLRQRGALEDIALAALVKGTKGAPRQVALTRMKALAASTAAADRRLFLAAAGASGAEQFDGPVAELFFAADRQSATLAMRAAGQSRRPFFVEPLIDGLRDPASAGAAGAALVQLGEAAVPALMRLLASGTDAGPRAAAARRLGEIATPEAMAALRSAIGDAALPVATAVARGLWTSRARLDRGERRRALDLAARELIRAAEARRAIADIAALEKGGLLRNALERLAGRFIAHAFLLLAVIRRQYGIDIAPLLGTGGGEQRGYLDELADSLLPPRLKKLGAALVAGGGASGEIMPPEQRLARLAAGEPAQSTWIEALARGLSTPNPKSTGRKAMALTTIEKVLLLKSSDILKPVPDELIADFAPAFASAYFGGGETVMREGEHGDCLYAVVSGRLTLGGSGAAASELGPGAILGEMEALSPGPRAATVKALDECHLLVVTAHQLDAMIATEAGIGAAVIKTLCERLRRADGGPR